MKLAALAVLAAACAHTPDLPLRPDLAPPPGSTTWTWKGDPRTELLARAWPATSSMRGAVVIMHGLKDYSARYAALATKLAAHGYDVFAFDLRGHGRSAGKRVAPDEWDDYVVDLDNFLADIEKREPAGKPVFLFGHSMGGAIAARTAEVHRPKLAGLILSGPAIAIDAAPLLIAITRLSGVLSPGAPALKLANSDFSSDPANEAAMDKDELIEQGAGPASTAAGLVAGMHDIWADADTLTMPVLALHGSADKLTAPSGSRALIETLRVQDKTLRIYDGYAHDLLHEPNGNGTKVEDDIIAWLDAHTGGAAAAAPVMYSGDLAGDPRGWTQAVSFEAGVGRVSINSTTFTGRFAIDMARPRPIGWYGALTGYYNAQDKALALRPVGVAANLGPTTIGIGAGVSLVGAKKFAYSAGAWIEQDAGPALHVRLFGEFDRTFTYMIDPIMGAVGSERVRYGLSLRFPGDKGYWPHAHAGVGPIITAGQDCARDPSAGAPLNCGWLVIGGLQLFGAD